MPAFHIGDKIVGDDKVFIIAELSANHGHDLSVAVESIKAIKETGADAVKLQTYTPDTITINCNNEYFQIKHGTIWDGKTLHDLYKEAFTPWEWHAELKKLAEGLGLVFFSSPFDRTAVDFLEALQVPAYKIASFEITDIGLIEYVASKQKPVIISTGIATPEEITDAIDACERVNNRQIALLKCTSAYPAPYEEINLRMIPDLMKRYQTVVGLSDHTNGIAIPVASVALGCKIIEKHFILDRKIGGPDASFSLEPVEFKNMVESVRAVESALGDVDYGLSALSKKSRVFARSLFVVKNIGKGEEFSESNIRSIRPGNGLPPKYLASIIGKRANKDIIEGTPLSWELIQKD